MNLAAHDLRRSSAWAWLPLQPRLLGKDSGPAFAANCRVRDGTTASVRGAAIGSAAQT
jgi:hypothetical protein